MEIAYHVKQRNEWTLLISVPIGDPYWENPHDQFAINHMLQTGEMTLVMGNSMWEIVKQEKQHEQ
jgi:hypothetical protein